MSAMRICVPVPVAEYYFWRADKFIFLIAWSRGLQFWRESKSKSRSHWRCVLSRWVLSNREIHKSIDVYVTSPRSTYGCDNCGAWLFVQKVLFTLEEHVKTTKTDKTRFFFAKKRWTCYTTNNCSIKSHFYQPILERKNCVWKTSKLLELCLLQHVETKNVFTFQPKKWLVSMTVKSAKPAVTFWIFLLRTKNQKLWCLVATIHIALQERQVTTTKKKNHLHFWRNFSTNQFQANPNPHQKS